MIGLDAFIISFSITKDHAFQYSMYDDHNNNNKKQKTKNNMIDSHINPTTFKNIVLILGTIDHHELTMAYWWPQ